MTPYLAQAATFLVEVLFGFAILMILLRFLLQWARADFYNPLVQSLVRLTNPLLVPLRRWVPGLLGLDMAALVLALLLQGCEILLLGVLAGHVPALPGLLLLTVAKLLDLLLGIVFWAVLIQSLLSWFASSSYHPAMALLHRLTEPMLAPVRRILPPMGGMDFSPLVVLVGAHIAKLLLVNPLTDQAVVLLR